MPAVFFTNLALLGGLAALGIPILIHLLLKRKTQRLRFSTVQFFVKQDEQANRRRKLRNWLLLAVRLLLVTLLVLAFARPYLKNSAAAGLLEKRRAAVFVLDRSASMHATAGGQTQWARALELARQTLTEFRGEDRAALVACSTRTETLSPLKPAPVIARLLNDVKPEFGSANLADGLRQALNVLPKADATTALTIYVVSDLQRNACQDLPTVPLPKEVELKVLNASDLFAPNLAILDVQVEGQIRPVARLHVKSFADEQANSLKTVLVVDGRELTQGMISLPAGAETNVVLSLPALKPGWHSVEARLQTKDSLKIDDARHRAFFIPEPVGVLCAETKGGSKIYERDSFFVASALQPTTDATNDIPSLFAVTLSAPDELRQKLTAEAQAKAPSAVVLPALRPIPAGLGDALAAFVRSGGGLLLFVGEGMSANRYNAEFLDLLPARLDKAESRPAGGWRLDEFDKTLSMFDPFAGALAVNLRLPEFTHRFSLTPHEGCSVLARFDDGTPLLLGRNVGNGRVVLVNTSAEASWSDWPKRKSFVPWLHGAVNYLANRSNKETLQPSALFTAGEDAKIVLGPRWKGAALTIAGGDGATDPVSATADDEGRLQHVSFTKPGIYSARDRNGTEVRRWSVGVPARESELASLTSQDFQKQVVRDKEPAPASLEANLFGEANGPRELWRLLLMAALLLLFVELFLANRTAV
jgi:hypothetical protein